MESDSAWLCGQGGTMRRHVGAAVGMALLVCLMAAASEAARGKARGEGDAEGKIHYKGREKSTTNIK